MSLTAVSNPLPGLPLFESPLFDRFFERADVDPLVQDLARQLRTTGYAVFDFPVDDFDRLSSQIVKELSPQFDFAGWRARKAERSGGMRVQDAMDCKAVREIATNARVLDLLHKLTGRRAFPFQTLNFPVGTDQHYHTDAIHFHSMPERFMLGVWVALEDIDEDQGPLYYYPGSHRLPVFENHHYGIRFAQGMIPPTQRDYEPVWRDLVEATGLKPAVFTPRKGQALIWAANLLHGGMEHKNLAKSRWSQVTHYYFEDCAYYTPMYSHIPTGVVFYREPLDVSTGVRRKNVFDGVPLDPAWIAHATPDLSKPDPKYLPAGFDPQRYLQLHPDLQAAGINPTVHYLTYGIHEGRRYK